MENVFEELVKLVGSHLINFNDDLNKYDKESIANNPGVPFLHWTRPSGTHLTFLPLHNSDYYPKDDATVVPYLFATANRRQLSEKPLETARCFVAPYEKWVTYFDGKELHSITPERAVDIADKYRRHVQGIWGGQDVQLSQ